MAGLLAVTFLVAISLAKHAKANPVSYNDGYRHPPNGVCTEYSIKVTATSTGYIWGIPRFKDNYDVVEFLTEIARKDSAEVFHPLSGVKNVTDTYEVAATFCTPKKTKGGKEKTVLLATHGLGYDRRYWASSYKPEDYSFVDYALDKGYSVFFYDRLGTGQSEKLSGYVNQSANQVAVMGELAKAIRAGKYTGNLGKPKSIVLVGHSFGSYTSQALIASQPDIVEGVVLTGIAYPNATDLAPLTFKWILEASASRIANQQSAQWHDRDTGYLNFGDIYAHVNAFFKQPDYEVPAAEYAQSIAQPFAAMEFLSLQTLNRNSSTFEGARRR